MKLAEALLERKSVKEQIKALKERAIRDACVQEGDQPAERPEDLVAEINRLAARLEALVIAINRTNMQARLPDGRSIMEAIARRDMLQLRYQGGEGPGRSRPAATRRLAGHPFGGQVSADHRYLRVAARGGRAREGVP